MEENNNRIIRRDGKKWINYRLDGRGPDTSHYKLELAIKRATRSIEKHGGGRLKILGDQNETLIHAIVINPVQ